MVRYITLLLFIGLALGQGAVDPLEAARLANAAAEKAQAEADAYTAAAIQAAAEKAVAQARSNAKQAKEDEKAIVLKTAVIYLRNGERIDGDIFEIGADDKYIMVRTDTLEHWTIERRIRYRDINYILHNNNGLTDYLQAAGKKPEPVIWSNSPELDVIKKTPTIPKVKKQQFESTDRDKRIANLKQNPIKSGRIGNRNNKQVENKYISKRTKRTIALVITGAILITIYADINNTSYYGWN